MSTHRAGEQCYPPCRGACPAGINVQAYIALTSRGKFKEALEVVRKYIPFPAVCGRVCFSPCEDACTRKDVDDSVNIRALKRLVADYELKMGKAEKPKALPITHKEKVAIIGSGPAGLSAAYDLIKLGYPVGVYERASKPGGMLRECIPGYRLPEEIVDAEIQYLKDLGIEITTNVVLGKDLTIDDLFKQGYNAVFLAVGAPKSLSLGCEGEDLRGVFHSLEFLGEVNAGKHVELGSRAAVIGGGNVAIDAARTAKRLGPSEVTVIYRRSEEEMPAHHKEVGEAKSEGVKFLFLTAPKRFVGKDGRLASIECLKMSLGPPDESGRRRPMPVEGSEFRVPVDAVILAIGETPDTSFLPKEIGFSKGNVIIADPVTLETKMLGVFAGGDAVTGPASVIEAIAQGKRAAVSIDRYLRGLDVRAGREEKIPEKKWVTNESQLKKKEGKPVPTIEPLERLGDFKEVELGFDVETGMAEARRCLFCGPCAECLEMEELCDADDAVVDEDRCIGCANCEKVCEFGAIKVQKSVAKVNYTLCKGCGACAVECPVMAISMTNFTNERIQSSMRQAKRTWTKNEPRVLVFVCNWSHSGNIDKLEGHSNVQVIPVKCAARVDQLHVLQAFWAEADGVLIISCADKECHYNFGASLAAKRAEEVRKWLGAVGIEPRRFRMERASAADEHALGRIVDGFVLDLKETAVKPLVR